MAVLSGDKAAVKVASGSVAIADEAMTLAGDKLSAQVTNAAHKYLDPTVTCVLEHNAGSGWATVPAADYSVRHCGGIVTFGVARPTGDQLRIDSAYMPV